MIEKIRAIIQAIGELAAPSVITIPHGPGSIYEGKPKKIFVRSARDGAEWAAVWQAGALDVRTEKTADTVYRHTFNVIDDLVCYAQREFVEPVYFVVATELAASVTCNDRDHSERGRMTFSASSTRETRDFLKIARANSVSIKDMADFAWRNSMLFEDQREAQILRQLGIAKTVEIGGESEAPDACEAAIQVGWRGKTSAGIPLPSTVVFHIPYFGQIASDKIPPIVTSLDLRLGFSPDDKEKAPRIYVNWPGESHFADQARGLIVNELLLRAGGTSVFSGSYDQTDFNEVASK